MHAVPTTAQAADPGCARQRRGAPRSAGRRPAGERAQGLGDVEAVAGIDLEIAGGEFFSMLGPSGSGKTTTLRMIAGFELTT